MRVALLVPLGAAGIAAVATSFGGTNIIQHAPEMAPAEAIAARFPENWSPEPAPLVQVASALPSDSESSQQLAFFSPMPAYATGGNASTGNDAATAAPAEPAPVTKPKAEERPERIPLPVPAPARRASASNDRPNTVLNDAQIASVKKRLNLTPDQERMWPAVEAALRNISYSKTAARTAAEIRVQGKQVATIDPNSADVQNLKYAAFPLLMSFSEPQKEEVRSLTRLMGLEQLAAMF
jgi:hypothetical protein